MLSNSTFENRRNIYTDFIDDKTNVDEVFFLQKNTTLFVQYKIKHYLCSVIGSPQVIKWEQSAIL